MKINVPAVSINSTSTSFPSNTTFFVILSQILEDLNEKKWFAYGGNDNGRVSTAESMSEVFPER